MYTTVYTSIVIIYIQSWFEIFMDTEIIWKFVDYSNKRVSKD